MFFYRDYPKVSLLGSRWVVSQIYIFSFIDWIYLILLSNSPKFKYFPSGITSIYL